MPDRQETGDSPYAIALPDRWKAAHPEAVREYREQERRDKADTAVVQAARRRVRAELRKRQIIRQKIHDRRAVPMGLLGSDDRAPPDMSEVRLWRIPWHPHAGAAGLQTVASI